MDCHWKAVLVCALTLSPALAAPSDVEVAFDDFVAKYGRTYENEEEKQKRFAIFATHFQYIQKQNALNSSFKLGVNEFADQAPHEFKSTRLGLSAPPTGKLWGSLAFLGTHMYSGAALPTEVDWVNKSAVTSPKNQGTCGSCWTFSTTGALEGAWQIATGKLFSLSEQQLVDCSKADGNNGCGGGSMDPAFSYLQAHGSCTEASYPYKAEAGTCMESNCTLEVPKNAIIGYHDVPTDDTKALMEAIAKQPVSVAIEADQTNFQLYQGGVLTKSCGSSLDHGVLAVGYGTDNGVDYWKVKNSWGSSWGENGYIRIERSSTSGPGECGIKSMASYPIVSVSATIVV
jgi:C1A family cysteine protease